MFRRDDAVSATETGDSYTSSASAVLSATTDTPSLFPVPSSTGRGLVVVETSTPPDSYSFSTPSADIPSPTVYSILPIAPIPTPSDSASPTLFYSINPVLSIAPVSISRWYTIPPVSASGSAAFPLTSLFPSAAVPSISPIPISDVTAIPTLSSTVASSTSLFYSNVTAADPGPLATLVYSILPVETISASSSSAATDSIPSRSVSADTIIPSRLVSTDSIPSTTVLFVTAADPIPASVSDTPSSSVLRVLQSATPDPAPEPTLVYSILPVSHSSTLVLPGSSPTATPTLVFPAVTPTAGPTSNHRTTDTPATDSYHSTTTSVTSLSTEEAPTSSSQRINNLALQPTADAGASSTVLVTSGSITRTLVVRPTDGTTGVGGGGSGGGPEEEGPFSGDTPSHHALPISTVLGSVFAGVVLVSLAVVFVVVRRRRRRVARWHRLPYEPALDTSRHSSRFLNPYTDIDDDWSIIASEVERPVSTTTTASTLAFAPSRGDSPFLPGDYTTRRSFGLPRSGGWVR